MWCQGEYKKVTIQSYHSILIAMEKKSHWESLLKQSYQSAPIEGPEMKRVKFSDIHQELANQFPSDEISVQCCSKAVDEVFPATKRARLGKQRLSYVVGLQEVNSTPDTMQAETEQLKATVNQLQGRIRELEATTSPSVSV